MLSFYFFPADLQSIGDELNRSFKTAYAIRRWRLKANIWIAFSVTKNCFLVFFRAGLHLLVRKFSMLSVKLFVFSHAQEAGHRLPAACGRDFWELVPFCPEGGREIGVISCEAQRVQGEDGYLGERGNTGQPGFSSARPQNGWNYVKFESFISMSLISYQCVNKPEIHIPHTFKTVAWGLLWEATTR